MTGSSWAFNILRWSLVNHFSIYGKLCMCTFQNCTGFLKNANFRKILVLFTSLKNWWMTRVSTFTTESGTQHIQVCHAFYIIKISQTGKKLQADL